MRVAGTDLLSTLPLAHFGPAGTGVRIGAGLFGAMGDQAIPGVRCALRVLAPVLRSADYLPGTLVGYGDAALEETAELLTARCGYADGIAPSLTGDGIEAVGMQYITAHARAVQNGHVVLLDQSSSLDAFAARSNTPVHQIITALGNCVRARRVTEKP